MKNSSESNFHDYDDLSDFHESFDHQILYQDENYFKGILIRIKEKDNLSIQIKIYAKFEHQIVKFVQIIYSDYEENCNIIMENNIEEEENRKEFIEGLRKEVEIIRESQMK